MSRLPEASPVDVEAEFGADAPTWLRITALRPGLARAFTAFSGSVMGTERVLPDRLLELVRLRVAFHNQCRSCMALRYMPADQVTEGDVCSLERPAEAPDLTDGERIALEYADRMATNHLSVDEAFFDRLRVHYDDGDIVELGMNIAVFVGFGRLHATWHMVDELPERFHATGEQITPWGEGPVVRIA